MRSGKLRLVTVIALISGGLLVSITVGRGTAHVVSEFAAPAMDQPPGLTIRRTPSRLAISATTVSVAQENSLLQAAQDSYAGADLAVDFRAGVVFPPDWSDASLRLLQALAPTLSASADMDGGRIRIRAITTEPQALTDGLDRLRAAAPAAVLDQQFLVVDNPPPIAELCRRNLAEASSTPVSFRQSSAALRSPSHSTLDSIVEVLNDCRAGTLIISGHSDASGDETWNQRLSLERARTVAGYFAQAGIDPTRLQAVGLGSSHPVADNSTPGGRNLNRRIEFEFSSL